MYKHDFKCLSEIDLDSTIPDGLFKIDRYHLVSVDQPNNINRGGIFISFKESLPVQVIRLPY